MVVYEDKSCSMVMGRNIANLYGIKTDILVTVCIVHIFQFRSKSKIKWVDLGSGNGTFFIELTNKIINTKEGIVKIEGTLVDVIDFKRKMPEGFQFTKMGILDYLHEKDNHDIASLFEVTEPFDKNHANQILNAAKSLADICIVSTPKGFLKQDGETHSEFMDNPFQWHKCGFSPEDLHQLGYCTVILKKYHIKPKGNKMTYDCIVGFYGLNENEVSMLKRWLILFCVKYYLNPFNLYRIFCRYAAAYYRAYLS